MTDDKVAGGGYRAIAKSAQVLETESLRSRRLDHFWLMTPSFLVLTFGMMFIGLRGMRRRIVDYDPAQGFDGTHLVLTICAFLIALSVLIFLINFFRSLKHGEKAEGNVWNSRSPEWQVPSPMPAHNYEVPFEVVGEPYDYGLPGSKYVEFSTAAAGKKHH